MFVRIHTSNWHTFVRRAVGASHHSPFVSTHSAPHTRTPTDATTAQHVAARVRQVEESVVAKSSLERWFSYIPVLGAAWNLLGGDQVSITYDLRDSSFRTVAGIVS